MTLQDKVVIVTGGALGIGRYVARRFAAEGARVAIADIAPMDTVVSEIKELTAEILPVKTDLRVESEVRALVEQVHARWGRIDVLLNNAAVAPHFPGGGRPAWPRVRDMDEGFFDRVVDTNLKGTFFCTKHVLPYMEAQREGHIISVGQGTVGARGSAGRIGYCLYHTTKVALRAFTRGVSEEEREFNICVVSMSPGSSGDGERRERDRRGGGIWTEDTPVENRSFMLPVESVGNRYLLAAEAPMDFTGNQLILKDGALAIAVD